MRFADQYSFRERLADELAADLVGPTDATSEELITDDPIVRYVSGVLYPKAQAIPDTLLESDGDDTEDAGSDGVETTEDPPVALAHVRYPSSMGMTFAVDTRATSEVVVHVRAARYEQREGGGDEVADLAPSRRKSSGSHRWARRPLTFKPVPVSVIDATDEARPLENGLDLHVRVRRADASGVASVTLALVNRLQLPPGEHKRDAYSFFQCGLTVLAEVSETAFVERPRVGRPSDEDLESHALLYRHVPEFAVGHGCSVAWEEHQDAPGRATSISTSYTPTYDLLLSDSNPAIDAEIFRMQLLATGARDDVLAALDEFQRGYADWIVDRQSEIPDLPNHLVHIAERHLKACDEAASRIKRGIAHLSYDDVSWEAFQLANEAMAEVRARTVWLAAGKNGDPDHTLARWRPFQLAFILLCLEGLGDPSSEDRRLADLLWFPTGGGKTEAYLGLMAFTILRRRLSRGDKGAGITVLMRYTLRLLTTQQFERATLLICALEMLRRGRDELGRPPIAIGLWVGGDGTPNTLSDARRALTDLKRGAEVVGGNPVQVRTCPWCGHALDARHYFIAEGGNRRLIVRCEQDDCEFASGLPVFVVDEDIYAYHPSLVIATADKFAGLPWRDSSAAMFNRDEPALLPPELIIQDELHLISGPLGTLAGHYETAIDMLCTHEGVPPKVVASTATIRRATDQSRRLFARDVRQFPPPGLDIRDSYFAVETPREEKASRLYVGLMAPGTSQTTLLVRAYAALLQRCFDMEGSDAQKDPYWTLLGYFNSLRVLGGARMQVQDDVVDRLNLLAEERGTGVRPSPNDIELTSRVDSGLIPTYLKQMAVRYPDDGAIDVILATNMISVGMDIDRLGLMVVMGQPQSTSEYIQSTSRVGRQYPGLVVTLYNAARSRDRSHYETFPAYHAALYRQVESTSVTPFSSRARDRALHALVVTLARLTIPGLANNADAANVGNYGPEIEDVKQLIIDRVAAVEPSETEHTRLEIDEVVNHWQSLASERTDLRYHDSKDGHRALLADAAPGGADGLPGFPTLWSLRDVDTTSNLYRVM